MEFVKTMNIVKFEFAGMPLGILTHTATHEDVKFMTQAYRGWLFGDMNSTFRK